jgi:hypothetical protein
MESSSNGSSKAVRFITIGVVQALAMIMMSSENNAPRVPVHWKAAELRLDVMIGTISMKLCRRQIDIPEPNHEV